MKLSPAGIAFLAKEEGEVLHVYNDSAGHPTIGVGHLVLPGENWSAGITHAQALALLAADVAPREAAVSAALKVPVSQNQFDALVSFAFNEGVGAFQSSTLLRLLNAGDVTGAADQFLQWTRAGADPKALLPRRQRERALFLSGAGTGLSSGGGGVGGVFIVGLIALSAYGLWKMS